MRVEDISCAKQVTNSHYTADMYVPHNAKLEDLPPEMLKRALCPKNIMRDWRVCKACQSGCRAGNLLVLRTARAEAQDKSNEVDKHGDRSKYWQHVQQLQEAAIAKVIKARKLVAQGMEREEAARAVGYSRWDTVHGVYKKHKDEVDRRERA